MERPEMGGDEVQPGRGLLRRQLAGSPIIFGIGDGNPLFFGTELELLVQNSLGRPIDHPGELGMDLVVVIPTGTPRRVFRVDQIAPSHGFRVSVGKDQIGAIVVAIGRPLGMVGGFIDGIQIGVEFDRGHAFGRLDISEDDHLARTHHHAIGDGTFVGGAVDIAPHS